MEYDTEGREIYVGYAAPGAAGSDPAWMIQKNTMDANSLVTSQRFADGSILFDKIWDNRNFYTY